MTESKKRLADQVRDLFRMPILLTEPVSINFIIELIDVFSSDEDDTWQAFNVNEKEIKIQKIVDTLEEEGVLVSSMTRVKERFFNDDIQRPKLPKRVRVYKFKR